MLGVEGEGQFLQWQVVGVRAPLGITTSLIFAASTEANSKVFFTLDKVSGTMKLLVDVTFTTYRKTHTRQNKT